MPRPGQPAASALRNRNRITNKSRLKIVRGNLDVEPIIPDEDEEKNRLLQSVAGVDQEDANEHHLQVVLSQAAVHVGQPSRAEGKDTAAPTAFIPVPDHTGVAGDYEKLYPSRRWKDPVSYVQSTYCVEELCAGALADGCTYYMDERDNEWLDRNNEEARGEGTSVQGCVSPSGNRASGRSAKAKGKEPEEQPTVISEDEFELVMGLYEKITHDKTEFLHHGLENGMAFPEFFEYQEVFSSPLPPATFVAYKAPSWLPEPSRLLCLARIVYPYWKERRLERAGHRIIPVLNFDESDTLNESYVCFRRRETKAIRKTRTAQVTSSDKLARLQAELQFPVQLAQSLLSREQVKMDHATQSQVIWDRRMKLVELRVKNPGLVEKGDDEILIDKERPSKKSDVSRVRLPAKHDSTAQAHAARAETQGPSPRERSALNQAKIDAAIAKQKETDQHWEDYLDTGYVTPMVAHSSRLFKYLNPSTSSVPTGTVKSQRRPLRLRYGRGGRAFIDRRPPSSHQVPKRRRISDEDEGMDVDDEADQRLAERWRFDGDDGPHYGPGGSDEQDRILVDDYDTSYLTHTVSLLSEGDVSTLLTDPTITRTTADGRKESYVPFRLGMLPPIMRTMPSASVKGMPSPGASAAPKQQTATATQNTALTQQPTPPSSATQQSQASSSPVRPMPAPQVTQNGRPAMTMPHIDMTKVGFGHGTLPKAEVATTDVPTPHPIYPNGSYAIPQYLHAQQLQSLKLANNMGNTGGMYMQMTVPAQVNGLATPTGTGGVKQATLSSSNGSRGSPSMAQVGLQQQQQVVGNSQGVY